MSDQPDAHTEKSRKASAAARASWQVMLVFVGWAILTGCKVEVPEGAILIFLGAILGNQSIFTAGNVKVHQIQSTPK